MSEDNFLSFISGIWIRHHLTLRYFRHILIKRYRCHLGSCTTEKNQATGKQFGRIITTQEWISTELQPNNDTNLKIDH